MQLGAFMFFTDETIGPAELGEALEERGFSSLWVPEHPHIPAARQTPFPGAYGGGELARHYYRLLDPFVALTAAATVTTRLRLGTGICLLALRDAVVTAKEIATLDHLAGGRFEFGVGYGWNADEFADHEQRFEDRHVVVREKVELMQGLWNAEVADYRGQHVRLEPSYSWPKPARHGAPRVWLGGNGPSTMRAAARWADVWFPTPSSPHLGDDVDAFRRIAADTGRADKVDVALAAAPGDEASLASFREMGVTEVAVALPVGGRDEVLAALDALADTRSAVSA